MIPALKNKATGMTHLLTENGQAWCGAPVDRFIPYRVSTRRTSNASGA
jgi:hypothetical protein